MSEGSGLAKLIVYGALTLAFNNPLWQDTKGAAKTLDDAGFKNVQTGGYSWFNSSDLYKTKFTATNANGKTVHGAVTSGLIFKGSSIRYDW